MKKFLKLSSFALSGVIMLFVAACNYVIVPDDEDATHKAVVKTAAVTSITSHSAICGGEIISDGGSDITACGVVWGLAENPAVNLGNSSRTVDSVGTFVSTVTPLQPGKTYYIRAYARNSHDGYAYGEQFSFTTDSAKVEMVDLGLDVKWASCNLGANSPEDFGDFYAWGELEPYYADGHSQDVPCKSFRTMRTGAGWSSGYYSLWGYFESGSRGYQEWSVAPYNLNGNLTKEFDAANYKLGKKWRIPTKQDWTSLFQNCTATWVDENGKVGYVFTSKSGNASIFIPAASKWNTEYITNYGDCNTWNAKEAGEKGYYWSSSLVTSDTTKQTAFAASFDKTSKTILDTTGFRYLGFSVRPVCDK